MEWLDDILEFTPEVIDLFGVVILLVGFIRGVIAFFKMEIGRFSEKKNWFNVIQILRCNVGLYILLALDFVITSDIIKSMMHTDINDLVNLGSIVILRTIIGYFLGKEVEEVHGNTKNK